MQEYILKWADGSRDDYRRIDAWGNRPLSKASPFLTTRRNHAFGEWYERYAGSFSVLRWTDTMQDKSL